ncbi:hypothetical protein [uncultured Enterovirga sp.]|uniref:hypothetical protein n=1 Tax=uncultured Enterovirga sp. TaxID=2026352 RepID=UPI0035CB9F66
MVTRNHNNRSEKQKGHVPVEDGAQASQDHAGIDERHDGKGRQNGGGDGAGGAPKAQGQGQANKGVDNHHQNRGHG